MVIKKDNPPMLPEPKVYKVGDTFTGDYSNPPMPFYRQWPVGAYIDIFNQEKTKKLARVEVTKSTPEQFTGRVINTFGHKRR